LVNFHKKVSTKKLPTLDKVKEEKLKQTYEENQKTDRSQKTETEKTERSYGPNELPELEIVEDPESIYIKPGKYLKEIVENPHYNIQNFELRRDQPLGRGAFGDVIVGINKKDGKKYAIKQVKFYNSN